VVVPLLAALACVMATPQSRAPDAGAVSVVVSSDASATAEMSLPAAAPLTVDSEETVLPAPDWSALASRSDEGGSICRVPSASHARLRVARGHSQRHLAAGAISATAAALLASDGQAAPILCPAHPSLAPPCVAVALAPLPSSSAPSPPSDRIDRPPRSPRA
jgi:hypothetical protein